MAGILRSVNAVLLRKPVLFKSLCPPRTASSQMFHNTSRNTSDTKNPGLIEEVHHPSEFDKKVLVWTKRYPSVADVPPTVTYSTIKKARDLFRVRVNIGMILFGVLGCILMVFTGRRARDQGQNLGERRKKWELQLREQGLREEAEKKANLAKSE